MAGAEAVLRVGLLFSPQNQHYFTVARETPAEFAMAAVYQKANKYNDRFPYSSMAEIMAYSFYVYIYIYIVLCILHSNVCRQKILWEWGKELPVHVSVASDMSNGFTAVPDSFCIALFSLLHWSIVGMVVHKSSSQCHFLRRVGMILPSLKNLHPECTNLVGNKVVVSLAYREK